MDIIDKIEEALKPKPSFDEWLNDKKNYRKIEKEFEKNYSEYANEYGQDVLDQREEEDDNEDPIAAYEDDAHNQGYQAEYDAANDTIYNLKKGFDYKRGDEQDDEKQYKLADKMGFRPSFR